MLNSQKTSYTEVFAWGDDQYGQLGVSGKKSNKNYPFPRFCSFNVIIHQISCGDQHSAFIATNGYIYTMGNNEEGRLGLSQRDIKYSYSPALVESLSRYKSIKVMCGQAHTIALVETGEVFTWGYGVDGQLGINNLNSQFSPQIVNFSHLENKIQSNQIIDISCNGNQSFVLFESKQFACFGSSDCGQLGTGSFNNEVFPVFSENFPEKIIKIACGYKHTVFLSESLKVFACGNNNNGQLGVGNKKNISFPIRINRLDNENISKIYASDHSAAINRNGELFIWGNNIFKENIYPQKIKSEIKFIDLALGNKFGFAFEQNTVFGWGNNGCGELGLGDYNNRDEITLISNLQNKNIKVLSCGFNFCLALGNTINKKDDFYNNSFQNTNIVIKKSEIKQNSNSIKALSSDEIRKRQKESIYESPKRIQENEYEYVPGANSETQRNSLIEEQNPNYDAEYYKKTNYKSSSFYNTKHQNIIKDNEQNLNFNRKIKHSHNKSEINPLSFEYENYFNEINNSKKNFDRSYNINNNFNILNKEIIKNRQNIDFSSSKEIIKNNNNNNTINTNFNSNEKFLNNKKEVKKNDYLDNNETDKLKQKIIELESQIDIFHINNNDIETLKNSQNFLQEKYLQLEKNYFLMEDNLMTEKKKNEDLKKINEEEKKKNKNVIIQINEKEKMLEKIEFLNQILQEKEQEIMLLKSEIAKREKYYEESTKELRNKFEIQFEEEIERLSEQIYKLKEENQNLNEKNDNLMQKQIENEDLITKIKELEKSKFSYQNTLKKLNSELINYQESHQKLQSIEQDYYMLKNLINEKDIELGQITKNMEDLLEKNEYLESNLNEEKIKNDQSINSYKRKLKESENKLYQKDCEIDQLKSIIDDVSIKQKEREPSFNYEKNATRYKYTNKLNEESEIQKKYIQYDRSITPNPTIKKLERTDLSPKYDYNNGEGYKQNNFIEEKITVREFLNNDVVKDSKSSLNNSGVINLHEMKTKINDLHKSKNALEKRMRDFEKRCKENKT